MHIHVHCERGEGSSDWNRVSNWQKFRSVCQEGRVMPRLIEEHEDEIRRAWQTNLGRRGFEQSK
ncbi:MAG: hypothetical protein CV081_05420 [Nitrospira sp. LK265]|nr:hypothetical protein [Nitrospira sp. LK265]